MSLLKPIEQDCAPGLVRVDADGRFLQADRNVQSLLGLSEQGLLRRRFHDITHPDDLARDVAQLERLLADGQGSYSMLKRYFHASGDVVWAELNVMIRPDKTGQSPEFLARIRKAAVCADALNDVHEKAFRDSLTSSPNRHALEEQLIAAERRAQRLGAVFAYVLVDLDGFKLVNDTLGHQAGDALLAQVYQRLQWSVRVQDFVARLGGDEFALIFYDIDKQGALEQRLMRVQQRLNRAFDLPQGKAEVSASLGAAVYGRDGASIPQLMAYADRQMYRTKRRQYLDRDRKLMRGISAA